MRLGFTFLLAGAAALVCGTTVTANAGPVTAAASTGDIAWAINDSGVIVGEGYTGAGVITGVRWETDGQLTLLPDLAGEYDSSAYNVNNTGVTVGVAATDPEQTTYTLHAVRWDANGTVADLDAANDLGLSVSLDVNTAGVAVGWSGQDAVRWDANGVGTVLADLPGGEGGSAVGINDLGSVVGSAGNAGGGSQAVRWAPDGSVTALGLVPGQSRAAAYEINDSGTMVGVATVSGGERAVRWSPSGSATLLGMLPGHVQSRVFDINDSGTAVGVSIAADGTARAVRWAPDGQITDLGTLPGATFGEAIGINNSGVIVGYGRIGEEFHALRWNTDGSITELSGPSAGSAANGLTSPRRPKAACLPDVPRTPVSLCARA